MIIFALCELFDSLFAVDDARYVYSYGEGVCGGASDQSDRDGLGADQSVCS